MSEHGFQPARDIEQHGNAAVNAKTEGRRVDCRNSDFLLDEREFERKVKNLSEAHLEILSLTARGYLNKQIAWARGSTEATIKSQQQEILRRLDVKSRTQAAVQFAIYCERVRSASRADCDDRPRRCD